CAPIGEPATAAVTARMARETVRDDVRILLLPSSRRAVRTVSRDAAANLVRAFGLGGLATACVLSAEDGGGCREEAEGLAAGASLRVFRADAVVLRDPPAAPALRSGRDRGAGQVVRLARDLLDVERGERAEEDRVLPALQRSRPETP